MGLDMYWELPKGILHPRFIPPLFLINCWTMEDGSLTFGDYSVDLFLLSGIPMHTKYISKSSVKRISELFDKTDHDKFLKANPVLEDTSLEEWNDLKRMFEAYTKIGGRIRVSW